MPYSKQTWSETTGSPNAQVTAARLAYIETGIETAQATAETATNPNGVLAVIEWDGTNWKYNGSTITARPTSGLAIRYVFLDPLGTSTWPAWMVAGDLGLKPWG